MNRENYDKYKEFIEFEIKHGRTKKFGWDNDIEEFSILDVAILYNEDDPEHDIIRVLCEYPYIDGKNFSLTYRQRTIEYLKTAYEDYKIELREKKLKEIGI